MKTGEFSIELINAETKEPLKEFTAPDGKVYVEAEPDLEYFIRCYRERDPFFRKHSIVEYDTTVEVRVDGTSLGYDETFFDKSRDLGLWKRQYNVDTFCALKLILKKQNRGAAGSYYNSNTMMPAVGSVNATFYEAIYFDGMLKPVDLDKMNCLNAKQSSAPAAASGAKKAFTSVSGSATVSKNVTPSRFRSRGRGRCLGEITIRYTSALGLSQLRIFDPIIPDTATSHNSSSTRPRNNDTHDHAGESAITEPKRKRMKTEPGLISPNCVRSDELIDLTGDE